MFYREEDGPQDDRLKVVDVLSIPQDLLHQQLERGGFEFHKSLAVAFHLREEASRLIAAEHPTAEAVQARAVAAMAGAAASRGAPAASGRPAPPPGEANNGPTSAESDSQRRKSSIDYSILLLKHHFL